VKVFLRRVFFSCLQAEFRLEVDDSENSSTFLFTRNIFQHFVQTFSGKRHEKQKQRDGREGAGSMSDGTEK
jgi:hypothetical protein